MIDEFDIITETSEREGWNHPDATRPETSINMPIMWRRCRVLQRKNSLRRHYAIILSANNNLLQQERNKTMDLRDFLALWRPVWSVMTILALWGLWSLKKLTATKEDLQLLQNRIVHNEKLLALIEEKCASRSDVHKLALRISALKATQKAQNEQLRTINDAVKRVENYLLENNQ